MNRARGVRMMRRMKYFLIAVSLFLAACSASQQSPAALQQVSPGTIESIEPVELGNPAAPADDGEDDAEPTFGDRLVVRLEDGRTVFLVYTGPRHFHAGQALLAAASTPGKAPATARLGGHPHEWYPLTEGPVIDLDALPAGQAVDAAVHRLLRLRRGKQVELHASTDPHLVWRQLDVLSPGGYGFAYLQDGPDRWRMQVTRRLADCTPHDANSRRSACSKPIVA